MLEVKNNRKRAEGDLQLLENRILMLKVGSLSSVSVYTIDFDYSVLYCELGGRAEGLVKGQGDEISSKRYTQASLHYLEF